MLKKLFVQLWQDETGAIIATEYLMLGSIVAAGGISGMVAMRYAIVDEFKEFGHTTREIRQNYTQRAMPHIKGKPASHTPITPVTPFAGMSEEMTPPTFHYVQPTP